MGCHGNQCFIWQSHLDMAPKGGVWLTYFKATVLEAKNQHTKSSHLEKAPGGNDFGDKDAWLSQGVIWQQRRRTAWGLSANVCCLLLALSFRAAVRRAPGPCLLITAN